MDYTPEDYDRYVTIIDDSEEKRYEDWAWAISKIGNMVGLDIQHERREWFKMDYYGMTACISISPYNGEFWVWAYPIGHEPPPGNLHHYENYTGNIRSNLESIKRYIDRTSWVNSYKRLVAPVG